MTQTIISVSEGRETVKEEPADKTKAKDKKGKPNKGKLKIDATVADQMIEYLFELS